MGRPIVPKEHGAWAVLYGAFLAGVGVAGQVTLPVVLFLLPFGMGATFFLLLRAFLVRERDDRTLIGELVGTAGLTMVGAAAHAVAVGEVQRVGALLWLLLFLFFASGVFYVRMRVQGLVAERKGGTTASNPALWPCVLYHGLLVVVVPALILVRVIPWPVLLAFAPALWRAAAPKESVRLWRMWTGLGRGEARLNLHRLGWSEVAAATAFVLLLIAAFRFTPLAG